MNLLFDQMHSMLNLLHVEELVFSFLEIKAFHALFSVSMHVWKWITHVWGGIWLLCAFGGGTPIRFEWPLGQGKTAALHFSQLL